MIESYAVIHVYKDGGYWVAKNIELGILTSHPDKMTAVTDIMKCTEAQIEFAKNNPNHEWIIDEQQGYAKCKFCYEEREYKCGQILIKNPNSEKDDICLQNR